LMDSELTSIASVKALNQGLATGNSPTFVNVTATSLDISGNIDVDGVTNLDVVDIDGAVDMASTLKVGGTTTVATDGTVQLVLNRADASIQNNNQIAQILVTGDDPSASQSGAAITFVAGSAWSNNVYATDIVFSNDVSGTLTERFVINADGTASFTGAITANAGVKVDNFTLDGTTLALSSGDMTLDVAGDIILDADGDNIFYKAGGDSFYSISNVSGNTYLGVEQADKDLVIRGSDGGVAITALTLDMSAAGAATFSSTIATTGLTVAGTTSGTVDAIVITNTSTTNNGLVIGVDSAENAFFWNGSNTAMTFATNNAERMRIDSAGNLIVSGTAAGQATSVALHNTGYVHAVSSHQMAGIFDRRDSDGDILLLRKQGATVGSIGSVSGKLQIDGPANNSGLRFHTNSLIPQKNKDVVDAQVDLGLSSHRFRELFLSGGVFLGGTGAANKLSDFETGTWTPTWTPASGSGQTIAAASGHYTKVGNRVFIDIHLATNGHGSASGNLTLGGLPFTQANNSGQNASLSCGQAANAGLVAGQACTARINQTATTITPLVWSATTGTTTMTVAQWGASGTWRFTGSYAV